MRPKRDSIVKARVDTATRNELGNLAAVRQLDVSDLVRQAVRDLLAREMRRHARAA